MTQKAVGEGALSLVSILQKCDYDRDRRRDGREQDGFNSTKVRLWHEAEEEQKERERSFNSTKVRLWQVWGWLTSHHTRVSILQKCDYDPTTWLKTSAFVKFQFYKSAIMTTHEEKRQDTFVKFQFYKSAIMTVHRYTLVIAWLSFNSTKCDYDPWTASYHWQYLVGFNSTKVRLWHIPCQP